MKKIVANLCSMFLVFSCAFSLLSCARNYTVHGIGNYEYIGDYNSTVEIDIFSGIKPLINDYSYTNADYYYDYIEDFYYYNVLERAIYYFEYTEEEYQIAKNYCMENLPELGEECIEEYNGFQFYDNYGKRNKEEYYHGDNYPEAFKRVAFSDNKRSIVFLGVYTSDKRSDEIAEDVKDWGTFLGEYFFEFYRFEE